MVAEPYVASRQASETAENSLRACFFSGGKILANSGYSLGETPPFVNSWEFLKDMFFGGGTILVYFGYFGPYF